jgi:hypothetical protein
MGRKGVCTGCWWGSQRERDHWGDPDVDVKIDLQEGGGGCEDWIELIQDRDRRRALVSTARNFLTGCEDSLASQEGLCSME